MRLGKQVYALASIAAAAVTLATRRTPTSIPISPTNSTATAYTASATTTRGWPRSPVSDWAMA